MDSDDRAPVVTTNTVSARRLCIVGARFSLLDRYLAKTRRRRKVIGDAPRAIFTVFVVLGSARRDDVFRSRPGRCRQNAR
jgi:hypothetical protein